MKWMKMLALLLAMLLPCAAQAAVYEIADESGLPAEWADKPLLRLTMLDAERSDSMLLECGGEAMLIDGGSAPYRDRLYDLLAKRGITELKYIYCSHSHDDHIGGVTYLIRTGEYQVGKLFNPNEESYKNTGEHHQRLVRAARNAGIPYEIIDEGAQITLGAATLDVMRCPEPWGQNARSASAMITFGSARMLTTGDIDHRTMGWYAERYGADKLSCDILKAPHHGQATVPDDFLAATTPELIIVTNKLKWLQENGTQGFIGWLNKVYKGPYKCSGDGAVVCVTDGTDWYFWQEPNWIKGK